MELDSISSSALSAFSTEMLVYAGNIAHINTAGFQARSVSLMSGPRGEGVHIAAIRRNTSPGPLLPCPVRLTEEAGSTERASGFCEGSNSDAAREFVHMLAVQRAFEASAAVIRTHNDVAESLLNMKI